MTMLGIMTMAAAVLVTLGSVLVLWIALDYPTGRAISYWIEDEWYDLRHWLRRKTKPVREWWERDE